MAGQRFAGTLIGAWLPGNHTVELRQVPVRQIFQRDRELVPFC